MTEGAANAYDSLAEDYDRGYVGPRWDLYDEVTMASAAPTLPAQGGSILDAGAGSGKFALRFLEMGHRVTLLDPSQGMLAQAKRKVDARGHADRASYVVGSILKMDFPDATFDAVFCEGDPLSYCLQDHPQAAAELLRVLKPGGGFYVSVDNRWNATLVRFAMGQPDVAFAAALEGRSTDPYGAPVHAFDPDELRRLFVGLGARDVVVAGKMCFSVYMHDEVLAKVLTPENRKRFLELETALAKSPATAALGGHLHVTGRKGGSA